MVFLTGKYNYFNMSLNALEFIFSSFYEHSQSTNYMLDTSQSTSEIQKEKAWLCFIYPCDAGSGSGGKLEGKPNYFQKKSTGM